MSCILLILLTLLASLVGTITGFGLSTIMIPGMLLFYPLPMTLLFVGIIHLFGDIWKVILFRKGINWKIVLWFGIPGILLSYIGASLSLQVPEIFLKRSLGVFLLLYVLYINKNPEWHLTDTKATSLLGGSLSGFFAGIFGVGGAIRSAFLSIYNLPKEVFIFTSGMIALFIDITRVSKYFFSSSHILEKEYVLLLLILVPVSLSGAWLAKKIVHRIAQKHFRPILSIMLGIIALKFILIPS